MLKYQKWLRLNTQSLNNKTVLLIGGTGSIGKMVLSYLDALGARIILAARNYDKALSITQKMILNKCEIISLDIALFASIDTFIERIKDYQIDYVINNSGVYNLGNYLSKDGYEIHFATNALGNYYLLKRLTACLKQTPKYILTSSISYHFYELNFGDFEGLNYKGAIKRYGLTKQIMMLNALKIKKANYQLNLVHPGICATELFQKSKSKLIKYFAYPFMKLIFHNAEKASLAIIKGIFINTSNDEWIGPSIWNIWGFPKVAKIKKKYLNDDLINKCNNYTEKYLELRENL